MSRNANRRKLHIDNEEWEYIIGKRENFYIFPPNNGKMITCSKEDLSKAKYGRCSCGSLAGDCDLGIDESYDRRPASIKKYIKENYYDINTN